MRVCKERMLKAQGGGTAASSLPRCPIYFTKRWQVAQSTGQGLGCADIWDMQVWGQEALGSGGWGSWDVTTLPSSHTTSPSVQASLLLQTWAPALARVKKLPCSEHKFRTAKAGHPQEGGELQKKGREGREAGRSLLAALQGKVPP